MSRADNLIQACYWDKDRKISASKVADFLELYTTIFNMTADGMIITSSDTMEAVGKLRMIATNE